MRRRRSYRRRKDSRKWFWLAGGLAVFLVVLCIALRMCGSQGVSSSEEDSAQETSAESDEQETRLAEEETGLPPKEQTPPQTEEETEEMTEAETEETEPETEEETEPPYLESLSGLSPGTVLSPEQIDFDHLDQYFMSWEIEEGDNLYERINGKSYRANDYVPLSTLRYLKLPHYNFNGDIQVGELIVNKDIQDDIFYIFRRLFEEQYQIQSMYLIDNYWTGDPDTTDWASIEENNTSAFCYREITGGGRLSNHAYGRAIDINPQQNPYVSYSTGSPSWAHENANDYIARDTGLPHVITHDDLTYRLFSERGFRWGGDWNNPKDYQHFDKNN